MAGQHAIADRASIKGETHMWTIVLNSINTVTVCKDSNSPMVACNNNHPTLFQLIMAGHAYGFTSRNLRVLNPGHHSESSNG
jgi:hypothetical protein